MTTKSSQAQAAAAIRTELKAAYPYTTFRIKSRGYTGGSSVDIDWTDGPTTSEVERITAKYAYGHFDGQIDLYEYSNRRDDIPQAMFVGCSRSHSLDTLADIVTYLNVFWGYGLVIDLNSCWIDRASDGLKPNGAGWKSEAVWQHFSPRSLVCRECSHPTAFADAYCGECGAKVAAS